MYRKLAQNLSSIIGILLKAKMKISFVEVRTTMMRLTLKEVTFFRKMPVKHAGLERGPNRALSKSKDIGIANQMNICEKSNTYVICMLDKIPLKIVAIFPSETVYYVQRTFQLLCNIDVSKDICKIQYTFYFENT